MRRRIAIRLIDLALRLNPGMSIMANARVISDGWRVEGSTATLTFATIAMPQPMILLNNYFEARQ